jgi:hypothetical protein
MFANDLARELPMVWGGIRVPGGDNGPVYPSREDPSALDKRLYIRSSWRMLVGDGCR